MAMNEYASIAAYIAAQPKAAQGPLQKVRSAVRKAIPTAKESLSYKIPTYKIDDKVVLYYRLTFTARASGESVEMSMAEVFTVHDGLIVELDVFYKNPSAVEALLAV
jgi:hypothetical protein